MSFTPGEGGAGLPNIGSLIGSGIDITDINGIDYISANLVAGPNVQLTPSVVDNSITISALGGGGGISNVTSTAGSGIITTNILPSGVELSSGLVAGTGIQFVAGAPGPTAKNLTINNTQTVSAGVGSGLTLTPAGTNTSFATNLTPGTGISVTPSTTTNAVQIGNTGVTQLTAGAGVAVSQSTGNVTISNTGVAVLQSGAGINVTNQGGGIFTATNTGLISATAGPGISVSSGSTPTISNTGVVQVVAGAGIAVSGGGTGTVTITNTDPSPATIVAGAGIAVNTAGGNTTISNTGVNAITSPVPGIQIGGSATNPTITNTGCIQVNAGAGINITGNQPSLPVIQNMGVLSVIAGQGIQVSQTTGNVTISAAPATIVAGAGIGVSSQGGNTTITNTGVNAITSAVPGIYIGGSATNPTITNTGVIQLNASGPGLLITGNQPHLPVIQNTGVTSITAVSPLVASSATGGVSLSLNGNIINRAVQQQNFNVSFTYNPGTAYAAVPFTLPPWFDNRSMMRCSIIFYDSAGVQWPNILGQSLTWNLRYTPSQFAPSFAWTGNAISKPAGATVLKMTYDYITFPQGTPNPTLANQIEFNNFNATTFNAIMTVVYEFIQYSTPLVQGQNIFYNQNWQGNTQGSYIVSETSNAVW